MIRSYADPKTEMLANGIPVLDYQAFERVALRKIRQLQAASTLQDLRIPPGNHLESLKGDRAGQYSIRINDQYRICFAWDNGQAKNVEIVDYHG